MEPKRYLFYMETLKSGMTGSFDRLIDKKTTNGNYQPNLDFLRVEFNISKTMNKGFPDLFCWRRLWCSCMVEWQGICFLQKQHFRSYWQHSCDRALDHIIIKFLCVRGYPNTYNPFAKFRQSAQQVKTTLPVWYHRKFKEWNMAISIRL